MLVTLSISVCAVLSIVYLIMYFKILPFGPVRNLMPYLIRRAEENTSIAGQTSRELLLISKELKRRKTENHGHW